MRVVLLVSSLLLSAVLCAQDSPESDIWFEDFDGLEALHLTPAEGHEFTSRVQRALADSDAKFEAPERWKGDTSPRIVFLSASDGRSRARVGTGAARGLSAATERALVQLRKRLVAKKAIWLKVDIVTRVAPREFVISRRALPWERSLGGIAFSRSSGIALLPEEILVYTVLNSGGSFQLPNFSRAIRGRGGSVPALGSGEAIAGQTIRKFETRSFFASGREIVILYRGHRVSEPVRSTELLPAAREAGAYLQRVTSVSGRFDYSYYPKTDSLSGKYNLVRHAGTVYSMLELYAVTRDASLLAAAERAIHHLLEYIIPYRGQEMLILLSDDKIKLGGVALAIVALVKHAEVTNSKTHVARAQKLARYIRDAQLESGKFISQRYYPSGVARTDFESQYYPGEAILALLRIHSQDRDETWLDTAESAAKYLIKIRDAGLPTLRLTHDHWLLYALRELHERRANPLYLSHAMRITQAMTAKQNVNPIISDMKGSYYIPPRSTPTATRSEGLLAAYRLAMNNSLSDDAARILRAAKLGVEFQLQTQFRPESVLYLKDPRRALGGFHKSLTDYEIRIDYVQHNISALLALREVLENP